MAADHALARLPRQFLASQVVIDLALAPEDVEWLREKWLAMSGRAGPPPATAPEAPQRAAPRQPGHELSEAELLATPNHQLDETDRQRKRWIITIDERKRKWEAEHPEERRSPEARPPPESKGTK